MNATALYAASTNHGQPFVIAKRRVNQTFVFKIAKNVSKSRTLPNPPGT